MIAIYTLGRLLIKEDGVQLTGFVSQKAVALFVYLVMHPGVHQRDVLADLFWSNTSNNQALKNLRTILSSLQKQLGGYLDITRQTLEVINRDGIWLDTRAFDERLDTIAERVAYPYSPRRQIKDLLDAIDLYSGEFLVGLKADNAPELDTWIMLEREHLHRRAVEALSQLTQVTLDNGYYAQGIEHARRLLTLEPWHEEAQRTMMRLLAFSGNRSAAIQQYHSFKRLLREELDIDPEPETEQLFTSIKTGRLQTVPHLRSNNLQQSAADFVEDAAIVAHIMDMLDSHDCRLLTLLGSGGMGKTSLAQHIAHRRLEDYRDGVFFVPMASLTSPNFVLQAILSAIGMPRPDTRRPVLDILIEQLMPQHMLIVLDNFEHLLDAAETITHILDAAPYVQFVVTSREQLQLQREHILPLQGLSLKPQGNHIAPALHLFELAARKQSPEFQLEQHLESVQRICERVDGLPLAIVIAAGWLNTLEPAAIADRIEANLDFLTANQRDLPERHRGIRALLDSTWETLDTEQQDVLMRLSVFPADFDVDAAVSISGAELPLLRQLVAKSLLQVDEDRRYMLHELLRRYCQNQADQAGLVDEARLAHYRYYYKWANDLHESSLPIHRQIALIEAEYHNLWHFDWLPMEEQQAYILHLARILTEYWVARGDFIKEGIALIEQGLMGETDDETRAYSLILLSKLRFQEGICDDETIADLQEALSVAESLHDVPLMGMALNDLERILAARGDYESARERLNQMVQLYENADSELAKHWRFKQIISRAYTNLGVTALQLGDFVVARDYARMGLQINIEEDDDLGIAVGHNTLAIIALDQGDYHTAHTHFTQALTLARTMRHTRLETIFSGNLAEVMHKQGEYQAAYEMYCDTLYAAQRIGNRKTIVNVLEQLVDVVLELNRAQQAAILYGASLSIRESINLAVQPREASIREQRTTRLAESLHASKLDALIAEGRAMPLEQVIELASSQPVTS